MTNSKKYNKEYYKRNKEKWNKLNPSNNPERRIYLKGWREENKEEQARLQSISRKNNRKKINKYYKKYYSKNKDKFQEYVKNHENEIIVRRETRNRFELGKFCIICNSKEDLQFHHWRYILPLNKRDFSTICKDCHYNIHYEINKAKLKRTK